MLKVTISAVLTAATVFLCAPASAQQTPKTRAQVSAELEELVSVGYQPGSERTQYPRGLQAAQQRVLEHRAKAATGLRDSNDAVDNVHQ
ncbi:DUF4148 domain-containing protein [Paraburkholderia dioscoreae]|jgi:hypothetical protein|uniref:DUF4148 domain-containing protein n=1 Tax=Paraburkholderia dioscoreae TaxID=2604047 RepID=A0A5Q4Z8B9_9BURK|nr:DUF4148 domain-containing protein [Paraburkholderia dioscoreae]VVD27541.1 conserved exported protein of unknown function [Paraburkholderia dioscoreae]